ncbi:hypothetical protein BDV59DRAFT_169053 [Aspergillus ambiguus]|uniref:SAP domain-containing protein n=1 Tax=Aspergillus ambiguus TaxID=176160 RepID=UPI003CCCAC91
MATDYSKKTNAELVEILKARSLPHTGKKAEMVARLQEADNKAKSDAPAAPATKTDNAEDVIDWEDDDVPAAETVTAKAPAGTTAPATTTDAKAATAPATQQEPNAAAADESKTESQTAVAPQESTEGTATVSTEEQKPAPNYAMGLPITEMEEELKKRKARAEKFGITDESKAAIEEAERKLERAKRFGAGAEEKPEVGVGRLDEALSTEKPRKRGRDNDQGGRGGKRRDIGGRNRFQRRGRGGNQNGRGQGQQGSNGNSNNHSGLSEKDRLAMEARKKRFGTAA